jgi:hypothetical protein
MRQGRDFMRRVLTVALVALAAACAPAEEAESMSAGCDARAATTWAARETTFSIEATTTGPDCARAVATLIVRDSSGVPVYTQSYATEHVMVLADARDTGAMQVALQGWTNPAANTIIQTSAALPDWPANADGPQGGEFPFYPEEGYDRESYMTLRANDLPLFCYVQGMESQACLAAADGEVTKIGVQTFPG